MKKIISFTLCFLLGAALCLAQKLPNKQENSAWAPANIKIDGKTDDWNNQFNAYNPGAAIFYSIANDSQNLYLLIQSKQQDVINTIISYGFTLALQNSEAKNDKSKVIISYPIFDINNKQPLRFTIGVADTNAAARTALMNSRNALLAGRVKSIGIYGINGLDTLSVYNEKGVKAASGFNENGAFTVEIAFPLSYLKNSIDTDKPFYYNLIINGYISNRAPPADASPGFLAGWQASGVEQAKKYSHNDLWGKYKLAKKI